VETEFGRKRAIEQSSCNKDFSCVKGFCPSFVTIEGAKIRKEATAKVHVGDLPLPDLPAINGTLNVVITGVGGTGVVTIGAILAMAAYVDGKGAGMMEMAGLAQKGGAVQIHCRIAETPEDIHAIRVASGECDTLIGGDLVVSAGSKTLALTASGRTGAVVNSHEIITGDFTRDTEFRIPSDRLQLSLERKLRDRVSFFDATKLAAALVGDSIYSNMIVFGAAWQRGLVPVSLEAVLRAIELNGAAVEKNVQAFDYGRWAAAFPEKVTEVLASNAAGRPKTLEERIAYRADHLRAYQGNALARRYQKRLEGISDRQLKEAVAMGYHKVLAYKDEYEVARLLAETRSKAEAEFDGELKLTYHLAPPLLAKEGPSGRPKKREYGSGMERFFPLLARLKFLRGTPFDPFGYLADRRMERRLVRQYERDLKIVLKRATVNPEAAIALAALPLDVRGFGPVKHANATTAARRRIELLAVLEAGAAPLEQAAE
jgi:indolepyruvate ferredoxin oxidoreductase